MTKSYEFTKNILTQTTFTKSKSHISWEEYVDSLTLISCLRSFFHCVLNPMPHFVHVYPFQITQTNWVCVLFQNIFSPICKVKIQSHRNILLIPQWEFHFFHPLESMQCSLNLLQNLSPTSCEKKHTWPWDLMQLQVIWKKSHTKSCPHFKRRTARKDNCGNPL